MEKGLQEKTGKPLEHWISVVKQSGIVKHSAIIAHLKETYNFTHGYANFVALKARKADAASMKEEDLLANQYRGKEHLKPIYKKLHSEISLLGNDITITPKKDSVSFIRKRQFALVKPATKTRIDLGLKLKDVPVQGRLESSGPFGTMCTHRVRLQTEEEVDEQLLGWLKAAYTKAE